MNLLSTGNPKVLKGMVRGFNTYILHLAPASLSGFNTCPKATAGCGIIGTMIRSKGGVDVEAGRYNNDPSLRSTIIWVVAKPAGYAIIHPYFERTTNEIYDLPPSHGNCLPIRIC